MQADYAEYDASIIGRIAENLYQLKLLFNRYTLIKQSPYKTVSNQHTHHLGPSLLCRENF